jgi:hypothetical protein
MPPPGGGLRTSLSWVMSGGGPVTAYQNSNTMFGPGIPFRPVDPQPVRTVEYPVNVNSVISPRASEPIGFAQLRAFANVEMVRLAIETRKDQIERMDWSVKVRNPRKARSDSEERIRRCEKFWRRPDGVMPFATWLRKSLEDVCVLDAPAFEMRRTRGGQLIGLDVIPGDSVKLLVDETGRRPLYPAPAYQQILYGRPWANLTTRDLLYVPRNPRAHKLYGFCYSSDTEVLTRRGWLPFSEVTTADQVATRNMSSKAFEWQLPTAIIAEPYEGEMYHFSSQSVDILVTPDHRMLYDSMPAGANGGVKRTRTRGEVIIPARVAATACNRMNKIPMTSTWEGQEVGERVFEIPQKVGRITVQRQYADGRPAQVYERAESMGNHLPVRMSGDDYCALMGAYLAEGNVRSAGGIEIAQRDTSKGYQAYASLVARILQGPAQHGGKAFVLPRRGMTDYFRQFGHAHEKFIPEEVMNATPRQLRIFWDHYMLGDGHYEKKVNVSGRGCGELYTPRISTVSRHMAGQLVEIAQKLGWSASMRTDRRSGKAMVVGRECNIRDRYIVTVRFSQGMQATAKKVEYSGTIHCVSVPNGIVYVRRNGKPAWCGNSPVEQIIVTVNTVLQRQASQLFHFGIGNIPAGILTAPEGWTPDQILQYQDYFDSRLSGNVGEKQKVIWAPAGTEYKAFKDAPLKDEFDEWLARIVCFAFSLPPTPFIKAMNRSSAEQADQTALEEGREPMLRWWKRIADEVIADELDCPDLVWSWEPADDIDPKIQSDIDDRRIRNGSATINEVRARYGDDPLPAGDTPRIYVANGALSLEAIDNAEITGLLGARVDNNPQKDMGAANPSVKTPGRKKAPTGNKGDRNS